MRAEAVAEDPTGGNEIVVRDLHFDLDPQRVGDWHPKGAHVAHYFNALSLFFPGGEWFFIESVRAAQRRLGPVGARGGVNGFLGQEAMHGREHQRYNAALERAGYPALYLEKRVRNLFRWLQRHLPLREQLAITTAIEHLTTIKAAHLLVEEETLRGADQTFAALWRWHAQEETEHRAVAFDVYSIVTAGEPLAQARRLAILLAVTPIFFSTLVVYHLLLVARAGRLGDFGSWRELLRFLFVRPGVWRRLVGPYFAYFRPGFHPARQ